MYSDSRDEMTQSEKHVILASERLTELEFGIDSLESRALALEVMAQTMLTAVMQRNQNDRNSL